MSVLDAVKDIFEASTQSPNRGDATEPESKGAYWCVECRHRLRDIDADGDDPDCPECGGEMEFERSSPSTGCAC
jgi:Zn finger protein HypA/HybF involved in hydrogenase expression